jgi:hypothetical protein
MSGLSKADLQWIKKFVDNYEYVVETYPELFTMDDIDDMKIASQILEEKLKDE